MVIGSSDARYYVGAAVGNTLLLMGFALLQVLLAAAFRWKSSPSVTSHRRATEDGGITGQATLRLGCTDAPLSSSSSLSSLRVVSWQYAFAKVRFPSLFVFPLMFFHQTIVAAGVTTVMSAEPGLVPVGVAIVLQAAVVLPVLVHVFVLRSSVFACEYDVGHRRDAGFLSLFFYGRGRWVDASASRCSGGDNASPARIASIGDESVSRQGVATETTTTTAAVQQASTGPSERNCETTSKRQQQQQQQGHYRFKQRFQFFFADYLPKARHFLLLEMAMNILCGVFQGLITPAYCKSLLFASVVAFGGFASAALYLRPYISLFYGIFSVSQALLQLVASAASILAVVTNRGDMLDLAAYSSSVCMYALVLQAVVGLWPKYRKLKRFMAMLCNNNNNDVNDRAPAVVVCGGESGHQQGRQQVAVIVAVTAGNTTAGTTTATLADLQNLTSSDPLELLMPPASGGSPVPTEAAETAEMIDMMRHQRDETTFLLRNSSFSSSRSERSSSSHHRHDRNHNSSNQQQALLSSPSVAVVVLGASPSPVPSYHSAKDKQSSRGADSDNKDKHDFKEEAEEEEEEGIANAAASTASSCRHRRTDVASNADSLADFLEEVVLAVNEAMQRDGAAVSCMQGGEGEINGNHDALQQGEREEEDLSKNGPLPRSSRPPPAAAFYLSGTEMADLEYSPLLTVKLKTQPSEETVAEEITTSCAGRRGMDEGQSRGRRTTTVNKCKQQDEDESDFEL
jgi:hypothetical protein